MNNQPFHGIIASRRNLFIGAGLLGITSTTLAACGPDGSASGGTAGAGGSNFGADQSYDLPPVGNFHTLSGVTGSIPTNLGYLRDLILLPGAIYRWQEQSYYYLLATEDSVVSEDGLSLDYIVRDELTWSDGSAITAKDVASTFALRYTMQAPVFSYIDDIEEVDEKTVRFTFNAAAPIAVYWIMRERIAPASEYEEFIEDATRMLNDRVDPSNPEVAQLVTSISEKPTESPVISGPFTIDTETITNSQLTLIKNDSGHRADTIEFDTITVYNGSTETITPLVLSGDVMYATDGFPVATTQQFESQGYRILRPPTYTGPGLFFNYSAKPEFADKKVRQALGFLLDRDRMGEISLGESGKGVTYLSGVADSSLETWVDNASREKLVAYETDPAKAEELLKEAGWTKEGNAWTTAEGNPATYQLIFPGDYVDWASTAQELSAQLNDFGFSVTPVGVDSSQQEVDVQDGSFELAIQGWGASNPFPTDAFIATLFTFNTPALGEGGGMQFPLQQTTDVVGEIDLEEEVTASATGTIDEIREKTSRLALAFNELLPVIPLVERYANNPVVTDAIAGFPEEDPLYMNSIYSDNFVPIFMFEGTIKPA
ncbi:ABC transporter substrate-binding protein [Brachybacterium sp. AOP42-E1-35]|uniref:ABC transporter substrate-binding protein n=1 Tax=Brachybacterium sp. AOP42-E1-35 TaxID=3457664 RepID=UPI00402ABA1B